MENSLELPAPYVEPLWRRVSDIKDGYFALDSALRAIAEAPPTDHGAEMVELPGEIAYKRSVFEDRARDPKVAKEIRRTYLSGALLSVGDHLADDEDVDRSPEFEFVRHVRNAVAHGNMFELNERALDMLDDFPAYLVHPDETHSHKIKGKLNGRECLFGFIGPDSVFAAFDAAVRRMEEIELGAERGSP